MDYQKIHDRIIDRARQRKISIEQYVERHHIIPRCEGGLDAGETVLLTRKEHRLIHLLRFKFTGIFGNLIAHNLMANTTETIKKFRHIFAKIGANAYHNKYKNQFPEIYREHQKNAGISGGKKCKERSVGFFGLSEKEKREARDKGRKTIVDNKLGMFSDEYREKHKLLMHRKVKTPAGVFDSMTEAADFYGIAPSTVTYRVKSENFSDWNYLAEKENCNE